MPAFVYVERYQLSRPGETSQQLENFALSFLDGLSSERAHG